MSKIDKILKIAKDVSVKPGEDFEEKIIEKIKNLENDAKDFLDENFLDFLKKENSRLYFFGKKVRENRGLIIFLSIFTTFLTTFLVIEYKKYLAKKQKNSGQKFF
jgi:biotin-(acetyl-CoA carboxylase) ligase